MNWMILSFEHAWSVTTHNLTYKSRDVSWNQLRLTAQLKAAVEQLDTLILAFEGASEKIQASDWLEIKAKGALKRFMASAVDAGQIPVELTPKDWSRFVDNAFRLLRCGGMRKPDDIGKTVQHALTEELNRLGAGNVPLSVSTLAIYIGMPIQGGPNQNTHGSLAPNNHGA